MAGHECPANGFAVGVLLGDGGGAQSGVDLGASLDAQRGAGTSQMLARSRHVRLMVVSIRAHGRPRTHLCAIALMAPLRSRGSLRTA